MADHMKIAGGLFVAVLMLLTAQPFNDDIQGLALETGATEMVKAIAVVFPFLWVGFIFIILAYTGYEVTQEIEF